MATNAERQKAWRDRRNSLAKEAEKLKEKLAKFMDVSDAEYTDIEPTESPATEEPKDE